MVISNDGGCVTSWYVENMDARKREVWKDAPLVCLTNLGVKEK